MSRPTTDAEDELPAIAALPISGDGRTDALLERLHAALIARGFRVAGALRSPAAAPAHCEAVLRVLPDGPEVRITQDLGACSTACRLDAGAIEHAAGLAMAAFERGADIVLLNRFGVSEAEGRGFRALIGAAVSRGVPVMIGVSEIRRAAFDAFCGGLAEQVAPREEAALGWCLAALGTGRPALAGAGAAR
ncbi:DUF2478 domain-containing protein [Oceanicella actignis]|uniref:DUF2478 domain-containing protein n=1 Tax=Oceanicella actignis TaxID=1189325 RepID=UPI0011E809F0|nr:DUF2478 domain-containing protein [Oceanicella actignis]TYO89992.1 uncharacterized protein DUF2478 [Oceanicella actignis]